MFYVHSPVALLYFEFIKSTAKARLGTGYFFYLQRKRKSLSFITSDFSRYIKISRMLLHHHPEREP